MFEKKPAIIASVILLTLFGAPLAATAASHSTVVSGVPTPIFQDDEDDEPEHEDDDEDGDDDSDEHEERHEIIPSVITVPGLGRGHHNRPPKGGLPTGTEELAPGVVDPNTTIQSLSGVDIADADYVVIASNDPEGAIPLEIANPNESNPIDVKLIHTNAKSPADNFLESAYLGMGALGLAALGLGSVATVRAVRVRRSGKSDYFYDNK